MTTRYQRKPNDCEWCDVSEHELTGPACPADYRLVSGPDKDDVVCEECWENHTDCDELCKVEPLEGALI